MMLSTEVLYDGGLSQKDRRAHYGKGILRPVEPCEEDLATSSIPAGSEGSKELHSAEELLATHEIVCKVTSGATMTCPICSKEFRRKDNLRVHMRNKHRIGDPTVCRHCGMSFRSYLRLNEHTKLCEMNQGSVMPRFIQNQ
ncbi:hypothetical protein EGW08_000459 [Elysia chlorotica]|uniref:C2H2-type domain-containing protein n=1 Tax=Elysia chlorotica TaxID=188477 RepID=A0A433UD33_ELYCH|nr:hypothetical protein EGW08_000459 [Elysia chlorotica]